MCGRYVSVKSSSDLVTLYGASALSAACSLRPTPSYGGGVAGPCGGDGSWLYGITRNLVSSHIRCNLRLWGALDAADVWEPERGILARSTQG